VAASVSVISVVMIQGLLLVVWVFIFLNSPLLHASFSPLAAGVTSPLHFANPSPPSSWADDLHLPAGEHAGHTTQKPERSAPASWSSGSLSVEGDDDYVVARGALGEL
jgi:hypothetical protein